MLLPLDTKVTANAISGDADAFGALYSHVWHDLYCFALHYLGSKEDAEDAVQDTAIEAFRGISGLKDENSFKNWIYVILVRQCKQRLPDVIKKRNTCDFDGIEYEIESKKDDYVEFDSSQTVLHNLSLITKDNRDVVLLSVVCGFTSNEISEILNLPSSTVRSRITRSLKFLKNNIKNATEFYT